MRELRCLGFHRADLIDLVAETLAELGVKHAFVVHGAGGLDEISLAGETLVAEVKSGSVRRFTVTPEDFGVTRAPIDAVRGGRRWKMRRPFARFSAGKDGPPRDIVIANAAAALVAADMAPSFLEGARLAAAALDFWQQPKKNSRRSWNSLKCRE